MKKLPLICLSFALLATNTTANEIEYTNENTIPCGELGVLLCDLNNNPVTGIKKSYYQDGNIEQEINLKKNGE